MANCPLYTTKIRPSENVGDSLIKINNNFYNLRKELCDLKAQIDGTIQVRTLFYYGPNAANEPTSGMQNNVTSRPSNTTIENFVNDPSQLNLTAISKVNDQAYVIYQKTGFYKNEVIRTTSGVATARVISTTIANIPWNTTTPERFDTYSPLFIIWLLVFDGIKYKTVEGFPKFSQAQTISSDSWNTPEVWSQY
jgi:hypothetical protein